MDPHDPKCILLKRDNTPEFKTVFQSPVKGARFTQDAMFIVVDTGTLWYQRVPNGTPMSVGERHSIYATSSTAWIASYFEQCLTVTHMWSNKIATLRMQVEQFMFSPNERWLLVQTRQQVQLFTLDVAGSVEMSTRLELPEVAVVNNEFLWLQNDTQILWRASKDGCLFELQTGRIVRRLKNNGFIKTENLLDPRGDVASQGLWLRAHEHPPTLEWTPRHLVTRSHDGNMFVWDKHNGRLERHDCNVKFCATTCKGRMVYAKDKLVDESSIELQCDLTGISKLVALNEIVLVQSSDRVQVVPLAERRGPFVIDSDAYDCVQVLVPDEDTWALVHSRDIKIFKSTSLIGCVRATEDLFDLSYDGLFLTVVYGDERVNRWRVSPDSTDLLWQRAWSRPDLTPMPCVLSTTSLVQLWIRPKQLCVHDLRTMTSKQIALPIHHDVDSVRNFVISPCETFVAYSCADVIHIVGITNSSHTSLTSGSTNMQVMSLKFSSTCALAIAYADGQVRIMDKSEWNKLTCPYCTKELANEFSRARHVKTCRSLSDLDRTARLTHQRRTACQFCKRRIHPSALGRHEKRCTQAPAKER